MTPKAGPARAGQSTPWLSMCVISMARGANPTVSGDVEITAATDRGLPALNGFEAGVADEDFSNVTAEIDEPATTDAKGAATIAVRFRR